MREKERSCRERERKRKRKCCEKMRSPEEAGSREERSKEVFGFYLGVWAIGRFRVPLWA